MILDLEVLHIHLFYSGWNQEYLSTLESPIDISRSTDVRSSPIVVADGSRRLIGSHTLSSLERRSAKLEGDRRDIYLRHSLVGM